MHRGCSCSKPAPSQLPRGISASWAVYPNPREAFPSSHMTPVHAKPILCVRTFPHHRGHRERDGTAKMSNILGFRENHFGFALKALCRCWTAHVYPRAAVSITAEPGHSQGADHTSEVSQERRFPPLGFSHCVDSDFYILCGLFPT